MATIDQNTYKKALDHPRANQWQELADAGRKVDAIVELRSQLRLELKAAKELVEYWCEVRHGNPVVTVHEIQTGNDTLRISKLKDNTYRVERVTLLVRTDNESIVWDIIAGIAAPGKR